MRWRLVLCLLGACGQPPPADGGPACHGGLSFSPCRTDAQPDPPVAADCTAQIGFERDPWGITLLGIGRDAPHPAFTISEARALCGRRALMAEVQPFAEVGFTHVLFEYEIPDVDGLETATRFTINVLVESLDAQPVSVDATLNTSVGARQGTWMISEDPPRWVEMSVPLRMHPFPHEEPLRGVVGLHIRRPWWGRVFIDEVGWR